MSCYVNSLGKHTLSIVFVWDKEVMRAWAIWIYRSRLTYLFGNRCLISCCSFKRALSFYNVKKFLSLLWGPYIFNAIVIVPFWHKFMRVDDFLEQLMPHRVQFAQYQSEANHQQAELYQARQSSDLCRLLLLSPRCSCSCSLFLRA